MKGVQTMKNSMKKFKTVAKTVKNILKICCKTIKVAITIVKFCFSFGSCFLCKCAKSSNKRARRLTP